jgi:hypothetical protein
MYLLIHHSIRGSNAHEYVSWFFQAGEMEVKNPLFLDDNTPVSPNAAGCKDNTTGNGVIPAAPVP